MSIPLSEQASEILRSLFSVNDQAAARKLIEEGCGNNLPFRGEMTDPKDFDRVRFGVMKLSYGSLEGLQSAVKLAQQDERDLLVSAGFAHEIEAHLEWFTRGIPVLESFKIVAPATLGLLAEELQSKLIELKPGFYEIEINRFCLRAYIEFGVRWPLRDAKLVTELLASDNRNRYLHGYNGSVRLAEITNFYNHAIDWPLLNPEIVKEELLRQIELVRHYCFPIIQDLKTADWIEIQTKKFGKKDLAYRKYWDDGKVKLPPAVAKIWKIRESQDKLRRFKSLHRIEEDTICSDEDFKVTHSSPTQITYSEPDKTVLISIEVAADGEGAVKYVQGIEKWMESDGSPADLNISEEKRAEIVSNVTLVLEYEFLERYLDMRELLIDISSTAFPENDWNEFVKKTDKSVNNQNKALLRLLAIIIIALIIAAIKIATHKP